jgi:Na+/proline symporter
LSFEKVGGIQGFTTLINAQHLPDFFSLSNSKYTISFLLGFLFYNVFYLGGQWSFIQRYTSVSSPKDAKKVPILFGIFYIFTPVIWMLPPMIFRAIKPIAENMDPAALIIQSEQAYMQMAQTVLPAGMLGLITISLIFATNSSVQGFLNISAGVITNDLYKAIYPNSTEKALMRVARLATLVVGIVVIGMGMLIPLMGGATNVILSVASITGGAMYLPVMWTLFSKRQNSYTVLGATIASLIISLGYKFLLPAINGESLSTAASMVMGAVVPVSIVAILELWLWITKKPATEYNRYQIYLSEKAAIIDVSPDTKVESDSENQFGKKMIGIGILVTAAIIGILGIISPSGRVYVILTSLVLLVLGAQIFLSSIKKK